MVQRSRKTADTDNDDDLLAAEIIYALSGLLIRNNHGKSCWKIGSRISIWILSWKLLLVLMSSSSKGQWYFIANYKTETE
ncbi:unnamed protein product [Rhizopus microsporus]